MSETTTPTPRAVGAGRTDDELRAAFTDGDLPVAVYGLGKMGLPIAATFAQRSGNVRGVDLDPDVVAAIEAGECPVAGEPDLPETVAEQVEAGGLSATTDGNAAARAATIHVVIVPTLVDDDDQPVLDHLQAAVETIGNGLAAGDAVFVESTVPPRTCRELVLPTLEAASGLELGEFGLAFCPERTASGRALVDIQSSYPKVVGGADAESTRVARVVYDEITDNDVVPVADCTTAECVKVFEGLYRDVNIALANELATFADEVGVDVVDAIDVANDVPYCDLHSPGAGVGGHCIPYYPYFLLAPFDTPAPMLATARERNDAMPAFTVDRLANLLADRRGTAVDANGATPGDGETVGDGEPAGDDEPAGDGEMPGETGTPNDVDPAGESGDSLVGADVVVLGATYRPGVDEIRASPAHGVIDECVARGATPTVVDPVCTDLDAFDATPASVEEFQASEPDGVVLVTDQPAFAGIDWDSFAPMAVVDGRQALDLSESDHDVYTVGRGRTN